MLMQSIDNPLIKSVLSDKSVKDKSSLLKDKPVTIPTEEEADGNLVHKPEQPKSENKSPILPKKVENKIKIEQMPKKEQMTKDPIDINRRRNLGRRLGPPLRASTSSIDSNSPESTLKPSVDISPPASIKERQSESIEISKANQFQVPADQITIIKQTTDHSNSTQVSTPPQDNDLIRQPMQGKSIIYVKKHKYRKIELIGKGGSSKVYKILSESGRILALKRVKLKGLDDSTIKGLMNEVSLLEKLNDDRIIRLYDWELNSESLLMVLEYGEVDLANLLQKENNPSFIKMYWEQVLILCLFRCCGQFMQFI